MPPMKKLIFLVAAERFITTLAAQNDRDAVGARVSHYTPLRIDPRAPYRLVLMIDESSQLVPEFRALRECPMTNSLDVVDDGGDVFTFIDFGIFEARGKSLKLSAPVKLFSFASDRGRIESATQGDSHGNVTSKTQSDGAFKKRPEFGQGVRIAQI